MIFKLYTPLFILLAFSACSSQKKVITPLEWKGKSVQFGSGGGVTGISTIYTLLENGQLFSRTGIVNATEQPRTDIEKAKTKAVFAKLAKVKWEDADISHPGNMYYTLAVKSGTKSHSVTWGDAKYQPNDDITTIYKELNTLISPVKQ